MGFSKEEVEKVVGVLGDGGIILYPTDTFWSLGCDATNSEAVQKLAKINGEHKGLFILALDNDGRLYNYFESIPELAWDIIDLAESPTTHVLPTAKNLAPEVITEDGSAAVRVIKEPFVQALIRKFGRAIVCSTANNSGEIQSNSFMAINESIKEKVDYIVEYGRANKGTIKASSIIKLGLKGEVKVIR
jgi:L-threonylcarbamoyladenylate synthase